MMLQQVRVKIGSVTILQSCDLRLHTLRARFPAFATAATPWQVELVKFAACPGNHTKADHGVDRMTFFEAAKRTVVLLVALGLSACATVDPNADFSEVDHYEGTARKIHEFNLAVDRTVLRPLSQGYDFATPELVKFLIGNGFSHLTLPRDFANYLLQGDIKTALETLGRFTINTVLGAGGFLDPATEFGLPVKETDFGLTLAKYGVGEGTYFIVPFFGPTTTRDGIGRVVDLAFDPTSYIGYVKPSLSPELAIGLLGLETIDFRDRYREAIDGILYESEDSYVSLRAVYLQRRRAQVAGQDDAASALPDIFDSN